MPAYSLHTATWVLGIYPPGVEIAGKLALDLRYNRGLVVQVGFSKRTHSKAIGVMMPAIENLGISLVWLEHNKNVDHVPGGHSMFSVYFDEAIGDQYFHRSDDKLVLFVANFMEQLFPEISGTLDMSHVTRWPMAIPNPTTGIYTQVAAMKQRIDLADCVQFASDYFTCTGQKLGHLLG